jgi:hypothetical protein
MPEQFLNGIDLKGNKAVNVASPSASTDAVNKAYVDNVAAGMSAHESARAATTTNITLSGTQTIDGVAVVAGDRVLVKNQSTASANGIYVVAAGAWTLATDSGQGDLTAGAFLTITEGSVNADTMWQLTTNNPITVGTTNQVWSQFAPGAVTITGGNGITVTSGVVAVNADGTSIIADGTSTRVNPSYSGLAKRYAAVIPAGSTSATITHNLGTTDVIVQVQDVSGANPLQVVADVSFTTNTVIITFGTAPTANEYRVQIIG